MMALPSGKNDGHATAALGPVFVTRSRRFENKGGEALPSKLMIERTREQAAMQVGLHILVSVQVGARRSPLTNATCAPSGENAGVVAYLTSGASDGVATSAPVLVSTSFDGVPGVEKIPWGRNGPLALGGSPLTSPRVPSGVRPMNENVRPSVVCVRIVAVPAGERS